MSRPMAAPWLVAEAGDDGPRTAQILHRVVEEAVAQACADDGGQRAVDENRLRDLRGEPLAFAEVGEQLGADQNCQRPHQSVIPDIEIANPEEDGIEIPNDTQHDRKRGFRVATLVFLRDAGPTAAKAGVKGRIQKGDSVPRQTDCGNGSSGALRRPAPARFISRPRHRPS